MPKKTEVFMDCFDEDIRQEIREFGKRITSISEREDIDFVILMARKAVCFVEALRKLRLTSFHCPVISDRVLDMNPEWLRKKRIAVIDDAIITGTTLYHVKRQLVDLECHVEVHALCVDSEHWQKEFIDPALPVCKLSNSRVASLCADIVTGISLLPLPYATDYPLYHEIKLSRATIENVVSHIDWRVFDVSTFMQSENHIFSLVVEPREGVLHDLSKKIGLDLTKGGLYKIRLYGRWTDDAHKDCICTVHPIVAFEPLQCGLVDELFKYTIKHSTSSDYLEGFFAGDNPQLYSGKLRIIQYSIAARIAEYWIDQINSVSSNSISLTTDIQNIHYLFPPPIISEIRDLFSNTKQICFNSEHAESFSKQKNDSFISQEKISISSINPWLVHQQLNNKFLELFHRFEVHLRELSETYKTRLFTNLEINKKFEKSLLRLSHGYSLREMNSWLTSSVKDRRLRLAIISHYLDIAIDKGIAVPTTCVQNGWVFRGYRHGEDVLFANEVKEIAYEIFRSYLAHKKQKDMPGIEVEKLSVIMIKKMLGKGLRDAANNSYSSDGETIGVRFSLHGAVVAKDCPKIYQAPSDYCFRNLMSQAEILTKAGGHRNDKETDTHYALGSWRPTYSQASTRSQELNAARIIGVLLGELRSLGRKRTERKLTQNELVLLASVMSPQDLCLALAAEVNLAATAFNMKKDLFTSLVDNPNALKALHLKEWRGIDYVLSVALSSGTWKLRSVLDDEPWEVVKRVHRALADDSIRQGVWADMWPESLRQDIKTRHPDLQKLLCNLARWVAYARSLFSEYCLASSVIIILRTFDKEVLSVCSLIHKRHVATWNKAKNTKRKEYVYNCLLENGQTEDIAHQSSQLLTTLLTAYYEMADSYDLIARVNNFQTESEVYIPEDFVKKGKLSLADVVNGTYLAEERMKAIISEFSRILAYKENLLSKTDCIAGSYGRIQPIYEYRHVMIIDVLSHKSDVYVDVMNKIAEMKVAYVKARNLSEVSIRIVKDAPTPNNEKRIIVTGYATSELTFCAWAVQQLCGQFETSDTRIWLFADLPCYLRLFAPQHSDVHEGKSFYRFMNAILKMENLQDGDLCIVSPENYDLFNIISNDEKLVGEDFSNAFELVHKESSSLEEEFGYDFQIQKRCVHNNYKKGRYMNNSVDIGIITVVADERRAVIHHLKGSNGFKPMHTGEKVARTFSLGSLPATGGEYHSVAVTQCLGQGNPSIVPIYNDLKKEFHPKVVVLLGICGSKHKTLKVGDVGLISDVIAYEPGAITNDGLLHDYKAMPACSESMKQLFEDCQAINGEDMELKASEGSPNEFFKVRKAVLASGEKTIRADESEVLDWLDKQDRNGYLVDKESVGFLEAFNAESLDKENPIKACAIIRVVSDGADPHKTKEFRYEIVKNAMKFLEALCSVADKGFSGRL